MDNLGYLVVGLFAALIAIIFCAHFSAKLAQLKNRSKLWGILGLLFNVPGLIIVCFLPSKREDSINTNPISYFFGKLPKLSKKTLYIAGGVLLAAVITIVAYDNIPGLIENHKYSRQITEQNKSKYPQSSVISGEIEKVYSCLESSFVLTKDSKLYCIGKQIAPQLEGEADGVIYNVAKKVLTNEKECYVLGNDNKLYVIMEPEPENDATDEIQTEESAEKNVPEFTLISDKVTDFSLSETTLGFIKNGTLYMYGNNACGQLGIGNTEAVTEPVAVISEASQVECESNFTVVRTNNGEVFAFGANAHKQFGKEEKEFFTPVSIAKNITQIAAGDNFIILLNNSGEVSVCGGNDCGQLGNGTTEKYDKFTVVLSGIRKIESERKSAFALSENNELYVWGQNNLGQLGINSTDNALLPTIAAKDISDFSTSGTHTITLDDSKSVRVTGYNNCGQAGKASAPKKFTTLISVK